MEGYVNLLSEFEPKGLVISPDSIFNIGKKPEWFDNELIKKIIKDIDGATVIYQEGLMDKWNYGISTRELSTGCKAVICVYFFPNKIYGSDTFGNNCWESIIEVAKSGRILNIAIRSWLDDICDYPDLVSYIKIDGRSFTDIEDLIDEINECRSRNREARKRAYGTSCIIQ